MLDRIKMIRKRAMVSINGQTDAFMMANGKLESNMAKAIIPIRKVSQKQAYGRKDRRNNGLNEFDKPCGLQLIIPYSTNKT